MHVAFTYNKKLLICNQSEWWRRGKQERDGWDLDLSCLIYPYSPGDSPDKSGAWAESTEETTLTAFVGIPIAAVEEERVDFFGGTTTLLGEDKKLINNTAWRFTHHDPCLQI